MHHSKAPDPRQELHPQINSDSLPITKGLDTPWYGWRIRHPQAMTKPRTICTISPIFGLMPEIYPFLGAWVGSQRKRPHCAFLGLALSCGYPIRLGLPKPRTVIMIFTFLIATHGRVSDLHRIRTISAVADTEAQARANLPGLPLVFVARIPCAKRGQA
ncbi:host cell division inhibitor Icd-like protein [Aeromonas enteropelogenes]|uniref:host cell division inhibitor Icd-like protein n=2 Tax=Aeromonadaceae TaxID=84642 RepID=UPI0031354708